MYAFAYGDSEQKRIQKMPSFLCDGMRKRLLGSCTKELVAGTINPKFLAKFRDSFCVKIVSIPDLAQRRVSPLPGLEIGRILPPLRGG